MRFTAVCSLSPPGFRRAADGQPLRHQSLDDRFRVPIAGGMSEVEGKFTNFAIEVAYDDQNVANSSAPRRSRRPASTPELPIATGPALARFDVNKFPG
jgi:hypothetical protein